MNGAIPGRYRHAAFVTSTTEIFSARPLRSLRAAAVSLTDSCVALYVQGVWRHRRQQQHRQRHVEAEYFLQQHGLVSLCLLSAVVVCPVRCVDDRAVVMQGERQQCVRRRGRCQLSDDVRNICKRFSFVSRSFCLLAAAG
jgi:hypothetical protein